MDHEGYHQSLKSWCPRKNVVVFLISGGVAKCLPSASFFCHPWLKAKALFTKTEVHWILDGPGDVSWLVVLEGPHVRRQSLRSAAFGQRSGQQFEFLGLPPGGACSMAIFA